MTGGLLVVAAHPDDEVLLAGGTLAACSAAGLPTAVLCLTRGELGPIADPVLATRQTLADVRLGELHASCTNLGVSSVECWQWPDGSLEPNLAAIADPLSSFLKARSPDAVITFGEDGLYYHSDHVTVHELTVGALHHLDDPPALYRSVWPKSLTHELDLELQRRGLPNDFWQIAPALFGTEDVADSFAIDVASFVDRKLHALRAHRTQIGANNAFAALDDGLAARFLGVERFAQLNAAYDWLKAALADD